MARGDGKTTRQLQRAIERAKEGAEVLYVTRGDVGYYIRLAQRIAAAPVNHIRREMTFDNCGAVRFVQDVSLRYDHVGGWRGVAAIDHAAQPTNDGWHLLQHPNIEIDGSVPDGSDKAEG